MSSVVGHTKLTSNASHLILKQPLQGLAELQVHLFGQAADIVMALDDLACDVEGFDAVGVDGALSQPARVCNFLCFGIEDFHEVATDNLALLLGFCDTG